MSQAAADPLAIALAQHQAGNLPLAEQLYRQILTASPQNAGACHLLGTLYLQAGRPADAVQWIAQAIALDPTSADFYSHLGAAYGALADHDAAVTSLRRAIQLAPNSASSHYNLGTALRNAGRLEEAVVSFRHAIAAGGSPETHYNLANTLRELKRFDEAEAAFREALRLRPDYVKAMINLGNLLRDRERLSESLEVLREAVAVDPAHANCHLNLGTALRDAGHHAEAVESLRRAVELAPDSAEACNNLGTALQALARFPEAVACYEQALKLDPQLPDAHFQRATWRLRQAEIAEGFAEYEWRWKCKSYSTRTFNQPRWDGAPLEGRAILLHAEQGLGDTMQFIRYAAAVKEQGGTVIVECQPALQTILESCPGIDQLVPAGAPLPDFDVHCPLMSLPGALGLSLDRLWRAPYLSADEKLVEAWRRNLAEYAGFRVGICWQGNPAHLFDVQRSFPLACFAPLAGVNRVRLISLQKGFASRQIADSPLEVVDLASRLDVKAGAFLDTAAVIKHLDLVITTDTAVAHLAGALGASVWLALSAHCDWRWFMDRRDSPWYPTMRLFRQTRLDEWGDVFQSIAAELRELIAARA